MLRSKLAAVTTVLVSAFTLAPAIPAIAATPPVYSVQFLGDGIPTAMNDTGTVVGVRTDQTTLANVPLISVGGSSWATLPLPAGYTSATPTDVNDAGVIVGNVNQGSTGTSRAARWTPSPTGYTAGLLPLAPGQTSALASGINDLGQVIGSRAGLFGLPDGFGWVYSDATGIVDLYATYGWFATPADINNNGVITSGVEIFDLDTGVATDIGSQASAAIGNIGGSVLNDADQVLGLSFGSGSLPIARVWRYTPGSGWLFIAGSSRYTTASDMNAAGTITYGEGLANAPGIYFDGLGTFALNALIDPAVTAAGWFAGGNAKIDDNGVVVAYATNSTTGARSALRLTPQGSFPPPAAPTGLTAVAHPPTDSEPYLSIDLSWVNADPALTQRFEMERRVSGTSTWSPIALVPPGMGTFHQDTTVTPGTRYDYRVRAVGVGGPSEWSNIASATAPTVTQTRVTNIALSAKLRRGVVNVGGTVTVRTDAGAALAGATVAVTWTYPNGSTTSATSVTDTQGQARVATSGGRGTYTLTVTGVTKSGTLFDSANSVLSRSITR